MKKKLFGAKLKAVLSVLLCLIFAVAFWFAVKYSQLNNTNAEAAVSFLNGRII